MIIIKEYLEIYGHRVEFIVSPLSDMVKYLKSEYNLEDNEEDFNANYGGLTFHVLGKDDRIKYTTIVWLNEFDLSSPDNLCTLTHECVHLAFKVADNCNLPYSKKNSENIAYLAGYFVKKFIEKYKEINDNAENEKN